MKSKKKKKKIIEWIMTHENIPTPLIAILNIEFDRKKLFKALNVDKHLIFHDFFFLHFIHVNNVNDSLGNVSIQMKLLYQTMQWKKANRSSFFFSDYTREKNVRPAVYLMVIRPQHFPFSKLLCFSRPATQPHLKS